MFQKQPKLKVIIHAFGLSQGPRSERHGMSPRTMGAHWKRSESCDLERIYGCLYVLFEAILVFTRNEQMRVFRGFLRQHKWVPSTRATLQVTSAFLGIFREKI